jgi:prepilin-type N-terminal cleavage/methylation domain-containing protein
MQERGFTLIELMLVVALIGTLSGIALPKLSNVMDRAKDARTRGNLGVLRSTLAIYNSDTGGWYPAEPATDLSSLVPAYIEKIPVAAPALGGHKPSNEVNMVWNLLGEQDGPGWTYDFNRYDPVVQPNPNPRGEYWGHIRVRCYHPNVNKQLWRNE